jgi:NAD(P)-dependent dehydrogenase (short-subunit alcohol dehydrogenase family)|tara:strand:- start:1470 stop:2168 length:699 start_codon:yes stop_codon:yes gene_type:complete
MANYLIIGGSSGIGQSLVHSLSKSGHSVTATYFQGETIEKIPSVTYLQYDVKNPFTDSDLLPESLDGLVYCPGAIDLKPFGRISPEQFIEDYDLQVVGAIRVLQAVSSKLLKGANPSIVFFSTVAVQSGFPFHSKVSASKGAIEGLTRALAAEYAPKIRVNAIAPSLTDTPLSSKLLSTAEKKEANAQRHPLKKIGEPKDLANLAEFLLSEKAAWITGQIIHVDGGMSSLKV